MLEQPLRQDALEGEDRREVRAGIAGAGFIGRVHARCARLAGARVVGVSASTADRGREAAGELGAERGFASSEELVGSPEVDVVHICTPNHLHLPLALAALEAGKHVIVEKPVALDATGAAELAAAAEAAGRIVTVPFAYRYYATVREARARVSAGELGRLSLLHGSYLQDWLHSPGDDNWRVEPELGGASRAFADIGSHWCDLVEFVSGHRITDLSAQLHTAVPERVRAASRQAFSSEGAGDGRRRVDTEDVAVAMFRTDAGAVGSLVISQVSAGRKNRLWLELDGDGGSVAFDQEQPETLWVGSRDGAHVVPRDPGGLSPEAARYAVIPAGHPQGYLDCFEAFVGETYAAIRGETPADGLPTVYDGLRAARVTEAVLDSARSGEWTEVPA